MGTGCEVWMGKQGWGVGGRVRVGTRGVLFLSAKRTKSRMRPCRPGSGSIANQIILFIFARAIYDVFVDGN